MAKAEYKSALRSKSLIKKALAKLMHEKELDRITVSDIIREADISRGTFYAHFPDIRSVLEQIETEEIKKLVSLVNKLKDEDEELSGAKAFLTCVFEYLYNDFEYYKMLMQSCFLNNYISRLVDIYYEETITKLLERDPSKDINEANIYMIYTTNGAKEVLISWLKGTINGTPDEMATRLAKLINLSNLYYA
ncbi:MAG: TetR/AcrR family transcriptional regulator C-terminal domain-containing protein [Clostridia bacterium]|nr:TetR/AcrR family transcriptional regulator C-terminal domain-containing protein [Clostridia bacterium]